MTTTITNILALPTSPLQGSGLVGIVITPGVPSYFKLEGTELNKITNVMWYPLSVASVEFETRQLILVGDTVGTFMIKVVNNFLSIVDRGGKLSFRLDTGDTITFPVKTYGPVSHQPLWQSPYEGLNTG
jgi:hypothetical protein